MKNIILMGERFEYILKIKKRKTISIKIGKEFIIEVTAPLGTNEYTIEQVLKKEERWIIKKIKKLKEVENFNGYYYLGELYYLKIKEVKSLYFKLELDSNKFMVYINSGILKEKREVIIKDNLEKFYKEQAVKVLKERTDYYSGILKVAPKNIVVKNQKTLWGSCSSKGNINYNYKIVMAPLKILDYIVVHELCHLVHMNHSKDFWHLVESIIPDFKERRNWLKENGYKLKI
ncbi:zinc-dependent protease [Clostridium botulinum B2 128]|uniref:M48 family metallopeptidase n=1 Tax=Clostridium botulinum TaxID=1491 RepID=UPI000581E185|nr:SprT family zinc-dependent metalloprotease [Clostridium botulinum]KEI82635.1 zinc-dependent protease [Clostridium botulinum B2 128]KEI93131.1 zinc-dependent protease [Clostridium botulinum B2 433]NFI42921.1 M48 family metallopeptidase [Clostridium botulinum]NFI77923.1 M48 family metallopeptidase [Clostridium botulinum]NFI85014.1 M48 family metallopeptidase [Clostridium botulinum]